MQTNTWRWQNPVYSWIFPWQEVCKKLSIPAEADQLLEFLSEAVNIYFNYTGSAKCLNISQQATGNLGDLGWDYQVKLEQYITIAVICVTNIV